MLRAAYFGQELLSTFDTSIGEIALIPTTGGIFTVHLTYIPESTDDKNTQEPVEVLIWDRKTDGGFPEAKILKQKVRNHIDKEKNLGHSDTPSSKAGSKTDEASSTTASAESKTTQINGQNGASVSTQEAENCEDCK